MNILHKKPQFGTLEYVLSEVSVKDYIDSVNRGKVKSYIKNRGDGKLKKSNIDKINNNFDVAELGQIGLAYQENSDDFIISEGHHRTEVLILRYQDGLLTENELQAKISVKIRPESKFMTSYVCLNQSSAHTPKDKLLNTDLAAGFLLDNIYKHALAKVNTGKTYTLNYSQRYIILDLIFQQKTTDMVPTIDSIIETRSLSSKHLNVSHKEKPIRIDGQLKSKIVDILYKYFLIIDAWDNKKETYTPEHQKEINDALSNCGFLFVLLVDGFTKNGVLKKLTPEQIIHRMSLPTKFKAACDRIKCIGRRNGPTIRTLLPYENFLGSF